MKTSTQPRHVIAILTGLISALPVSRAFAGTPAKPVKELNLEIVPEMIGDQLGTGLKIGENESPRPLDRVYLNYNYFNDVGGPRNLRGLGGIGGPGGPAGFGGPGTLGVPAGFLNGGDSLDVHRITLGFEKTFLDGKASVGIRVPLIIDSFSGGGNVFGTGLGGGVNGVMTNNQIVGRTATPGAVRNGSHTDTNLGDISLIGKYALSSTDHSVISAGLVLTLPTTTADRDSGDVKFQPFLGGLYSWGKFYVQGFTSVAIPTDSRDTTWWYNDVGMGYHLLSTPIGCLQQITPIAEIHVNTPVDNNDLQKTSVNFTGGLNLQFPKGISMTFGAGTPLTTPKTYDMEAVAQFNFRF